MSGTIFTLPFVAHTDITALAATLPETVERVLPESFHLTLAVMPAAELLTATQSESLALLGEMLAKLHKPVALRLTSIHQFADDDGDGQAAVVARVDSAGAVALRNAIVMACAAVDIEVGGYAVFVPHITLGYGPVGVIESTDLEKPLAIEAGQLALWIGPGQLYWDLTGTKVRPRITGGDKRMPNDLPAGVELKATPHFVKTITGRTVIGIFSVMGNRDSYDDICENGAFLKTFRERGAEILHLWQHDTWCPPIAKVDMLRELRREELPPEVLAKAPDATGGAEVTRTYLETPRANEVFDNLTAKVPLQMSFMFDPVVSRVIEDDAAQYGYTRFLSELRLWETSDVNWGANSATLASKRFGRPEVGLKTILEDLERKILEIKKGGRHSSADTKLIDTIHQHIVDLGCTVCAGVISEDDDAKSADILAGRLLLLLEKTPDLKDGPSLAPLTRALARAVAIDPVVETTTPDVNDPQVESRAADVDAAPTPSPVLIPTSRYQQRVRLIEIERKQRERAMRNA